MTTKHPHEGKHIKAYMYHRHTTGMSMYVSMY